MFHEIFHEINIPFIWKQYSSPGIIPAQAGTNGPADPRRDLELSHVLWFGMLPFPEKSDFPLAQGMLEKPPMPHQIRTKLMNRRIHSLFSTPLHNEFLLKTSAEHFRDDLFCLC